MARLKTISLCILTFFLWASAVQAQDILAVDKMKAVKGLKDVCLFLRPHVDFEVLTLQEIGDALRASLKQRIPELRITGDSENWLILTYFLGSTGGFLELSLYRTVIIPANGEVIRAQIWRDGIFISGRPDAKALREKCIDVLSSHFAEEFYRANRSW